MTFNKRFALGAIGIVLAMGMVFLAVVSVSATGLSLYQPGTRDGQVSAQAQTVKINSITYVVNHGKPQTLNLANPVIDIGLLDYLFLTVKSECTGPVSQKGMLYIGELSKNIDHNGILTTPGKVSTLKTNPPLRWTSTGNKSIDVEAYSPDGHVFGIMIFVNVT